jgi:hypothetical protein
MRHEPSLHCSSRAGASSAGENFIENEVRPDRLWPLPVEEIASDRFLDVGAHLRPRAALGEDVVRKAFSHVAVCFPRHAEYDFHGRIIAVCPFLDKVELDMFITPVSRH